MSDTAPEGLTLAPPRVEALNACAPSFSGDARGETSAPKSSQLGKVAMTAGIAVLAACLAASVLVGLFETTVYNDSTANYSGFRMQPNEVMAGLQILFGTGIGIWALVLGIVATAKNRGRRFGVFAIVTAGAAPGLSLLIFAIFGSLFEHRAVTSL
jgi:hypothetical protein